MRDIAYGIAKTIMDGIKDAEMQYEYAVAASELGKPDISGRHIEEAKKRLIGVKEWTDYGAKILGGSPDTLAPVLLELLNQQQKQALDKIASFKPGQ